MCAETAYLAVGDVIALHAEIMVRTGAHPSAIRDAGLLEAAVARPRMAAFYEAADTVRQSVLLAVGVSQARVCIDGNKRTAYAALEVFLDMNGLEFIGDVIELAD